MVVQSKNKNSFIKNTLKELNKQVKEEKRAEPRYKVVFVINIDLRMSNGKVISQCMHAYDELLEKTRSTPFLAQTYALWKAEGAAKITLKGTRSKMSQIAEAASKTGINHSEVIDGGRTEVKSGSMTVVAVGPGLCEDIDRVTGGLPIY
ncbi:PTH [Enterospora canceri]|uniref:peptidyl-tRNA hydrolase n=1 Tax=Enterospora canceri TaxID=1081671 RepID=A0A1Y1S525_9MICR|nr:PTH [Enterospora canceri]